MLNTQWEVMIGTTHFPRRIINLSLIAFIWYGTVEKPCIIFQIATDSHCKGIVFCGFVAFFLDFVFIFGCFICGLSQSYFVACRMYLWPGNRHRRNEKKHSISDDDNDDADDRKTTQKNDKNGKCVENSFRRWLLSRMMMFSDIHIQLHIYIIFWMRFGMKIQTKTILFTWKKNMNKILRSKCV